MVPAFPQRNLIDATHKTCFLSIVEGVASLLVSKQTFVDVYYDKPIDFPEALFTPPSNRKEAWPDFPDLRTAVDWLKTSMPAEEWRSRRNAACRRLLEPTFVTLTQQTGPR